jgi:hypothetical protein
MMADLVTSLCEKVPVYHYSCLKDESAVNVLKKELFSL